MTMTRSPWTLISGVWLVQKGHSFLKDNLFSLINIMDPIVDIPSLFCKFCSVCDSADNEFYCTVYSFLKREIILQLFSVTNQKYLVTSLHIYKSGR